jgi:hypothetical protein
MKSTLVLSLILCLRAFAGPPEAQVTAFTLTKGSLVFDSGGVTFRTGNQDQRFPFSTGQFFNSSIPGLQIIGFQARAVASGSSGSERDVSTLTVRGEDGRSIDLTFGQGVEIYRADIAFSDERHLTLWKLAWEMGPPAQSQYISVTGGIGTPGRVAWRHDLTLLGAIISAGGPIDGFHPPRAYLIRGGVRTLYKVDAIINKKIPDPPLEPGDQIEVPEQSGVPNF